MPWIVALAATAAMVGLRALADPWLGSRQPLATMYGATAIAVWVGGWRAGALAVVLGYLACDWLFMAPRGGLGLRGPGDVAGLMVYVLSCALIVGFGEALRRANARALEAEKVLREMDRRKDEFLATLAHELRNPLAPIKTAAEILRRLEPGNAVLMGPRDIIDRQVRHLTRLVDDLLDASRITQGKVTLRRERLDARTALEAAIEAAKPALDDARHEFTVALPDAPLWVHADPTRITQIVANLLDNAAKYTPPGGRVALSARQDGGEAVIRVADNGVGIAPEAAGQIFRTFSQLAPAGSGPGGLGIGLALVKGFTELHGGRVSMASAGPGRGSEFEVRLPLAGEGA